MTACNKDESSFACYYSEKEETFLGDLYSVIWMEYSDEVCPSLCYFPLVLCIVEGVQSHSVSLSMCCLGLLQTSLCFSFLMRGYCEMLC